LYITITSAPFEDESLGLMVRGPKIVPNSALHTKIAIYTPEIAEAILSEHSEIISKWLERLHKQYVDAKRACEAENDPAACFNISLYDEFERHYAAWQDGGLVAIELPDGTAVRVRNVKSGLSTLAAGTSKAGQATSSKSSFVCHRCLAVFETLDQLEKHLKQEKEAKQQDTAKGTDVVERGKKVSLNSPWWTAAD
jgi:hypothetical protein